MAGVLTKDYAGKKGVGARFEEELSNSLKSNMTVVRLGAYLADKGLNDNCNRYMLRNASKFRKEGGRFDKLE